MRMSQKELEDNFDTVMDMLENGTIKMVYIGEGNNSTENDVVMVSVETYEDMTKCLK